MKFAPYISAVLFTLCACCSLSVRAAQVAIVLDNSMSMCGYLDKNGSTTYENLLKSLQKAIQSNDEATALGMLSESTLLDSRGAVTAALDRIITGRAPPTLPTTKSKRRNPPEPGVNSNCIFRANSSKLEQIFESRFADADLTLLVTDLIFDGGQDGGGGSASATDFIDHYKHWLHIAQQPSRSTSENHRKSGKPSRSKAAVPPAENHVTPHSWAQFSAGIIAIRSKFEGNYYFVETEQRKLHLSSDARPVYVFWSARNAELAQSWLKSILNSMQELESNNPPLVIQLLPFSTLVDPQNPILATLPQPLSALVEALNPEIAYSNRRYEQALNDYEEKKRKNKPDYPFNASVNPSNCFAVEKFEVSFNTRCGKRGDRDELFWENSKIDDVRITYTAENDLPGVERHYNPQAEGFREGSYRVEYKTGTSSKAKIVISISRRSSGFFDAKNPQSQSPWRIELNEQLRVTDSFDLGLLDDWTTDKEPCEGSECEERNKKTLGFKGFVQSLLQRGEGVKFSNNYLQETASKNASQIEFIPTDRLPGQ